MRLPIGDEWVTTDATHGEEIVVTSPFDGHEIGRVPRADEAVVARAIAAARAAHDAGPLPLWRRAEILDRAADGLDRGRNQVVYGVDVMTTPSLVLLRLRAVDDVELEVWGARRKRGLLEKVLGREVELSLHPSLR